MNVSAAQLSCRGHTPNIDKDITADQSGSTQAEGLITERDAGKQTDHGGLNSSRDKPAAACLQEDDGEQHIEENRRRPNGIDNTAGWFV